MKSGSALFCLILNLASFVSASAGVDVDLSGYREGSGVDVRSGGEKLTVSWALDAGKAEYGRLVLDLQPGKALVENLGIAASPTGEAIAILRDVDPVTFITVGTRVSPPDKPPGMSVFNIFFDSPARRPSERFRATLEPRKVRVSGKGGRATIAIGELKAGPFSGDLEISVYDGSRLVHVEAVVSTNREATAFVYDAGLAAASTPGWTHLSWVDTDGFLRRVEARPNDVDRPRSVRHRAIVAETPGGSIASFPPPHQFFYPRDITDNQQTVWSGRGHRGQDDRPGFGIRQTETGGGNFVPWFNAPPGTEQRLGVFYLVSRERAEKAIGEVLRFTHGDRFPEIPGRTTFTSHWHMALTMAALKEQESGTTRTTPDLVKMFKEMNVNIVHLAEFHGDGHPRDPGSVRLNELAAMFAECQRLSDDRLLLLPGEEANSQLSAQGAGRETGHWLYLFPRPVFWTMTRGKNQPFQDVVSPFGQVYHVGGPVDMTRLLETEHGLGWTAHPRIKGSSFTPDAYRDEPFFRSDGWLGAAWKAMPADLSSPRLGSRVLDLMDDMANWGLRKYVPGEVDVFKIDHTHELYGHMNINYLAIDRAPRFKDDWSPVLDALQRGKFFVTTGEVLLRGFGAGDKVSGETLRPAEDGRVPIRLDLEWTFPMRFAEVISGDGVRVYRDRIDLTTTRAFDRGTYTLRLDLKGRSWVRVEAWDIAANGTFSQPVWIEKAR